MAQSKRQLSHILETFLYCFQIYDPAGILHPYLEVLHSGIQSISFFFFLLKLTEKEKENSRSQKAGN